MVHHLAAVGGTFDHFHIGHQQLLNTALNTANGIIVGITHPDLSLNKSLANQIEPFSVRRQNVADYLDQNGYQHKYELLELTDPFGPTITNSQIDSLVVSEMTAPGAVLLNQTRQTKQLSPLPVVVTPMVADESGHHISSSKIRAGQITRYGKVYKKLFTQKISFSPLQLEQLKQLKAPNFTPNSLTSATSVVLVGDMVTQYFINHQLQFDYAIIDGKTKRQPTQFSYPNPRLLTGQNPPGTINSQIAQAIISDAPSRPSGTIYQVNGEEDLLAFVPCLTEPLGSVVLYGQPEVGIVMINLTEANKIFFAQFINSGFI